MAALNDQWQAARQLRQSVVVKRREQVAAKLSTWQQERFVSGDLLRQKLAQTARTLQAETGQWLAQTTEQRAAQIPQMRQALLNFTEQLQAQAQRLLASYQADRHLKKITQRQHLSQERQELQDVVSELHLSFIQDLQVIQRQVWAMQQQVAVERAGYRQHQALIRASLWPELVHYLADLQTQVEATLTSLTEARQQAEVNCRRQRQQERLALSTRVDELFDRLNEFRQQLQVQRSQLTAQVWGTESPISNLPEAAQAVSKVAAKPDSQPSARLASPGARSTSSVNQPVAHPTTANSASTARPMPLARSSAVGSMPQTSGTTVATLTPPMAGPQTSAPSAPSSQVQPLEDVVYNYLHLANGAHLSEIESELGINRFQAVDALRALIQKNLIVKHDRTYRIQEEAVL
ncbi:MAG: hypothetical protein HC929_20985 [Leptolyngbyaceae cyanobacterium SM2_5_2]|nr:hypothetical protein [Leptolyngbyaceae cyanobacterium SM2_5_2]